MTRVVLICAGPTPWDDEDRLVGNQSLPLTDAGEATIRQLVAAMAYRVNSVYRFRRNEACDQTAIIVAERFKLRARDHASLDEVNLGLWQGMTRSELRFRHPSVTAEWQANPLAVKPPDGEMLGDALDRLRDGTRRILRRNRGTTVALVLRPLALQIVLGILRRHDIMTIARHLHIVATAETIEIDDADYGAILQ